MHNFQICQTSLLPMLLIGGLPPAAVLLNTSMSNYLSLSVRLRARGICGHGYLLLVCVIFKHANPIFKPGVMDMVTCLQL